MEPSAPPPADDRLLERLSALGPVLDDLTREADERQGRGGGHGRARPPARHRALVAVAAVVLLVAGVVGLLVLGSDGGDTVTADEPRTTTTTESDAAFSARLAERARRTEQCGPVLTRDQVPTPWPEGWQMVMGPDCATGYVQTPKDGARPVPIYVEPEITEAVGYWSEATGWIDVAEYRDPSFDLARYRAVYQAAVEAQRPVGGGD